MRGSLIVLALIAMPAWAQVTVEQPWSRATPPGSKIGAGYLKLNNAGSRAERLVGADTPVADHVELHLTSREDGVMRMRQVPSFEIPARGSFEFRPGKAHLMLIDLKHPLQEGERVPITLKLENGGEVKAELLVEKMGARAPTHHQQHR